MLHTEKDWILEYEKRNAFWLHAGDPKFPHVRLTGNFHSNGYFNSELVMEDPVFLDQACLELVRRLRGGGLDLTQIDRVVGPAMGAIDMASEIAYHISTIAMRTCLRAYAEKSSVGGVKRMVFKRTNIYNGERILIVEDVTTTGRSVKLVADAVQRAGGIVVPFVVLLVNRSGREKLHGRQIFALVNRSMSKWSPKKCPLCKKGSRALRPKGTKNWSQLMEKKSFAMRIRDLPYFNDRTNEEIILSRLIESGQALRRSENQGWDIEVGGLGPMT